MTRAPLFHVALGDDIQLQPASPEEDQALERLRQEFARPQTHQKLRDREKAQQEEDQADCLVEQPGARILLKTGDNRWYRVIRVGNELCAYRGEPRDYITTVLPTLAGEHPSEVQREILLKVYGEVGSAWRYLTDVRFKLLGLVPAVSVIAWTQLISTDVLKQPPGAFVGILLSYLGLHLTSALRVYDRRNDGLYNDLVSRGRKIEEELGIDTAIFRGRPKAPNPSISHGAATSAIYGAVRFGWILVALWFAGICAAPLVRPWLDRWISMVRG